MADDLDRDTETGVDLTSALSAHEREALFAALDADDHDGALQLLAVAEARTGHVNNPGGNEGQLRKYWLTGAGGRRIRWKGKGAFARCVAEVSATGAAHELTDVKAYCASLYNAANGRWPRAKTTRTKKEGGPVTVTDTRTTEAAETIDGRVLEARGNGTGGGRVFRVEVIRAGRSRNGRDYPLGVLESAAPLYEGAQVYDGHRDDGALRSSAVGGLVGYLSGVTATGAGLEADLHLMPSAARVGEALDVALGLAAGGRPTPFVGLSHDVMATFRPAADGAQEATAITAVNSVDVVAVPAAGGRPVRAVAGGTEAPAAVLHDQATARGRSLIDAETTARGLPASVAAKVAASLPQQFTEADLSARLDLAHDARAATEAIPKGVGPVGTTQTVTDERDRKLAALDAFFDMSPGRSAVAYRSIVEAYIDITRPRLDFLSGEDMARRVLGAGGYDSARRSTESLDSTSWAQVLGDSVTRQMVAEYGAVPQWQDWQQLCSSVAYGVDFRTQRRTRFGGYGILPAVNQGAPYEPLTSPPDEEATYAATKRGGTEDITWEMIRNDDMDSIRRIPRRLGRSAAITLYRFVFDFLANNITCTYDSTALFHTNHANTATSAALSQSALDAGRVSMRQKTAYGDASDMLSLVPRFLLVPSVLESLAWQLCTSLVAIPSGGSLGPTDIPNLHMGLTPVVVDYWSDTNDWFLLGDPVQAPTFELGFVGPSDQPELFTQSDPNQGSMFDADILTYKIRHVYGGTWVDHRSAYRGQG